MALRDCLGHGRLIAALARAVHRGSLPPSLVFGGPEGVGKRSVALALAQTLNCPHTRPYPPLDIDACGTCPTCQRIARGVHPDVIVVQPGESGAIKVEQVRDVVDRAAYRPFEGRRRAVLIDDADALVPQAQNALLKTLEEPPAGSVFLLVTARPDALLPTVQSRCPRLRFRPLDDEDVVSALRARGATEAEARAVAATAHGSIGRALEVHAGDLVESRDIAARVLLHATSGEQARHRLEGTKELLAKTGAGGAQDREQLSGHLRAMATLIRDVAVLGAGDDTIALANADLRTDLQRLAAFRGERGLRAYAAIDRALAALDGNASTKIVADWIVLQL
jgi:DNA polymerase-3 subunit delta'